MWILGDIYSVWVLLRLNLYIYVFFKTNFGENLTIIYLNIFFKCSLSSIIQELQLHPCLKISLTSLRLFISSNHFLCFGLDYLY